LNSYQLERNLNMPLTKSDQIDSIAEQNGYNKKQSSDIIEVLLELIKSTLSSGEDIMISGFGRFIVQDKGERRGRNPYTGGVKMLRPRKRVAFKCSRMLRKKMNQG
jgi:integration host factor subunit alpha